MGYRSQVSIGFDKAAFAKHVGKDIETFKDCDNIIQNENSVIFIWDHVKWYDDYEDVKSVESVITRISEEEDGDELYGFIRVGEEVTDIEERGYPYNFEMSVSRTIELDYSNSVSLEEYFTANSLKFIKDQGEK